MQDDPANDIPVVDDDLADDEDDLDGCELDFTVYPTSDEEVELMPLFAEALDPDTPKTVEEAAQEWRELGYVLPDRDS